MSWMGEYWPNHGSDALVIELEDAFGHYHIARSVEAPSATCGKRGRAMRLLPLSTWNGAPGAFPSTFCGRCSKLTGVVSREIQLELFRKAIVRREELRAHVESCVASGRYDSVDALVLLEDPDTLEGHAFRSIANNFESRAVVGAGWVDIVGEVERVRRGRDHDHGCLDWMPNSILYARALP